MTIIETNSEINLWDRATRAYLRFLRSRNRSPATLETYGVTLAMVPSDMPLTREGIESWFDHLWDTQQPSSVLHHHKALRAFFNWCVEHEYLDVSPMKGIPEPRVKPGVVEPFTIEQTRALYRAAYRHRDRTLVAVLLNTGIRIGEACRLRPEDVQPGRLKIQGKGSRERWVGIEPRTESLLSSYIFGLDTPTIFDSDRFRLYSAIRRMGKRAGVPKAHPHRFRDTFAVRFLEAGGGVDDLQVILGHSHISMTLRYVQYGRAERAIKGQLRYAPRVF